MAQKLNPLQNFLVKLAGIEMTREVLQNVEVLKEKDKIITAYAKKTMNLQGQLGRILKLYNQKKKEAEDFDVKREIAEKLSEEAKKIEKEELGDYVSIDNLIKKIYGIDIKQKKGKFGEKLVFTDRNGIKSYNYGGIGFYTKGKIVFRDSEGNDLVSAHLPRNFLKIESFPSMLKKGIIQMNVDENLEYHSEWEEMEIPDQYYDEEEHLIKETDELQVKAKDLIREKIMENRVLKDKVSQFEIAYSDIARELDSFKRMVILLSKTNKTTNADFSAIVEKVTELQKTTYEMAQKIVNITEENAMNEDLIESQEEQIKKLKEKAEVVGSNTTFENARSIHDDIADMVAGRQKKVEAK